MVDVFEKIKAIVAEYDAKIQEAVQPLVKSGSDTVVNAVDGLLKQIHEPVKGFFKSLDVDWTDEEKDKRVKEYLEGKKIT